MKGLEVNITFMGEWTSSQPDYPVPVSKAHCHTVWSAVTVIPLESSLGSLMLCSLEWKQKQRVMLYGKLPCVFVCLYMQHPDFKYFWWGKFLLPFFLFSSTLGRLDEGLGGKHYLHGIDTFSQTIRYQSQRLTFTQSLREVTRFTDIVCVSVEAKVMVYRKLPCVHATCDMSWLKYFWWGKVQFSRL